MQFQVPQFIETEDKIVGPLTLRQFVYIAAAAGVSFLMFFTLATWLWFIITIFLAGIAFGAAFIKINGQPLTKIMLAAFKFYWQPQTFVWQSETPSSPRNREASLPSAMKPRLSVEDVVAGMALRSTWQRLQTGTKKNPSEPVAEAARKIKERYQIFEKITGERRAARRVDYR